MKKIISLLALFACIISLFACGDDGQMKGSTLINKIYSSSRAPQKKNEEITPPGDPLPTEYLRRADDRLIGERISVKLKDSELWGTSIIFSPETSDKRETTVLIMSNEKRHILAELETSYGDIDAFRREFDGCVAGTLKSNSIICAWDYIYPMNIIRYTEKKEADESEGGRLFAYCSPDGEAEIYTESEIQDLKQIRRVYERFGLDFD